MLAYMYVHVHENGEREGLTEPHEEGGRKIRVNLMRKKEGGRERERETERQRWRRRQRDTLKPTHKHRKGKACVENSLP